MINAAKQQQTFWHGHQKFICMLTAIPMRAHSINYANSTDGNAASPVEAL